MVLENGGVEARLNDAGQTSGGESYASPQALRSAEEKGASRIVGEEDRARTQPASRRAHRPGTPGRRNARTLLNPRTFQFLSASELQALELETPSPTTRAVSASWRAVSGTRVSNSSTSPAARTQKKGSGRGLLAVSALALAAFAFIAWIAWGGTTSRQETSSTVPAANISSLASTALATAPGPGEVAQANMVTSTIEGRSVVTYSGPLTGAVALAWSPDNRIVALGSSDKMVLLLDTQTGKVQSLTGHTDIVYNVAWSPDGKTIASAGTDKTVRLWGADGASVATLTGHASPLSGLGWTPDGKMVASISAGSEGLKLLQWDREGTPAGESTSAKTEGVSSITSVAWSPDGKMFVTGSTDGMVRIWSSRGAPLAPLATLQGHTDGVFTVAWSPDGKTIASGSGDKTVRLWDASGKLLATLSGHTDFVNSVAWSPDGKTLASGSGDKAVRLWGAAGASVATLPHGSTSPLFVAWSPDGTKVASIASDSTVWLWNLP